MSRLQKGFLEQRQALPLECKIEMSKDRIQDWYDFWGTNVYLAFSGGKDSTVLLDLIKSCVGVYSCPVVFCDTGLEYPELREFALDRADVVLKPEIPFNEVISKHGYPVYSKSVANKIRLYQNGHTGVIKYIEGNALDKNGRKSMYNFSKKARMLAGAPFKISEKYCNVMKKDPMKAYERETGRKRIVGTMACESMMRRQSYIAHGCNAFDIAEPTSQPLGFWTEQDILQYIKTKKLEYAPVYGELIETKDGLKFTGEQRTGCMFCMFGVHLEDEPNRFQRMQITHPKQYRYCMEQLGIKNVLEYMGVPYENEKTLFDFQEKEQ